MVIGDLKDLKKKKIKKMRIFSTYTINIYYCVIIGTYPPPVTNQHKVYY